MKTHVAKCGYRCDQCPAFKPVLTDADKQDMVRVFKRYYGFDFPIEAIKPCTGCQSSDVPNDKECPVFPCVLQKGFQTCAECDDFGCDKLSQRMDAVEDILKNQADMPPEDFEKYFKPFLSRQTLMEMRQKMEE